METKITSQNGTAIVAGRQANFSASESAVNLNLGINISVSINRQTKEVVEQNYGAALDDNMTIGELKALMVAGVTELDATL